MNIMNITKRNRQFIDRKNMAAIYGFLSEAMAPRTYVPHVLTVLGRHGLPRLPTSTTDGDKLDKVLKRGIKMKSALHIYPLFSKQGKF